MKTFDFLWPVTVDGKHRGDIRFTGVVYQSLSPLTKEFYMDWDFDTITWVTKHVTTHMTETIYLFEWPVSKHFPEKRIILDLLLDKYYNPTYLQKDDEFDLLFENVKILQ
jgi:hypothetical protein